MRACPLLLPVLLLAAGLPPAPAVAQSEPAPRGWLSRIFPRTPPRAPQTLMLRDPGAIMRQDQRRETILEETAAAQRMADHKQRLLLELRSDRDRRVAVAIARAAANRPFSAPGNVRLATAETTGEVATGTSSSSSQTATPPPFVPGDERDKTVAQRAADTVDGIVGNIGQKIFNTPAAQPLPPGLFALALIGMFLAPSIGVGLLLIGIAHWRGHSFVSGTIILTIGALMLWGTWSLAKTINPNLLGNPSQDSQRAARTPDNPSPINSMRSHLFWPSDQ